jgi:hypothetical protein
MRERESGISGGMFVATARAIVLIVALAAAGIGALLVFF